MSSGVDSSDFHFFGSFIDRFAQRGELSWRYDDRCRVPGDSVLEDRDLSIDVGFRLSTELRHVNTKGLSGLARSSEHDLPEGGRCIFDDDRNGRFFRGRDCLDRTGNKGCSKQTESDAVRERTKEFHGGVLSLLTRRKCVLHPARAALTVPDLFIYKITVLSP